MKQKEALRFLDLFAGIGGFRLAMEQAGHHCVGFCEIDKFARQSYKAIFQTENEVEFHDITTVTPEEISQIGRVDVICAGFPCQSFSIAGRRRGFEDTRGTLFFEIARFASILQPKYMVLENVRGLLNHDRGTTYETIVRSLDELGYDCEWQLLKSKNYVPQNRERIFIVAHLRGECTNIIFPIRRNEAAANSECAIKKIGNIRQKGKSQSGDVVDITGISPTMCSTTTQKDALKIILPVNSPDQLNVRQNGRRVKQDGEDMFTLTTVDRHGILLAGNLPTTYEQQGRVYHPKSVSPTLTTMQGGGQVPKILVHEATKAGTVEVSLGDSVNVSHLSSRTRRGRVGRQSANTILPDAKQAVLTNNFEIRKLTPLETWRLQGFPDWCFLAAKFGSRSIAKEILINQLNHYDVPFPQKVSNSQLYKQAGNSVTTNVVFEIARLL